MKSTNDAFAWKKLEAAILSEVVKNHMKLFRGIIIIISALMCEELDTSANFENSQNLDLF